MFSIAVVSGQVYIPGMDSSAVTDQTNTKPANVVVRGNASGFLQEVVSGKHHLRGDEPASAGGGDVGPDPYDHLLASLVVCTSMTSGFYARRNKLPLENITVSDVHIGDQYPAASRSEINNVVNCTLVAPKAFGVMSAGSLRSLHRPGQRTRLQHPVRRNIDYNIIFRQKVCGKI